MFGIKDNWKDAGCYTTGCFEPSGAFTPESDHPTMTAAAERARYLNGGPESVNADLLAALSGLCPLGANGPLDAAIAECRRAKQPTLAERLTALGNQARAAIQRAS